MGFASDGQWALSLLADAKLWNSVAVSKQIFCVFWSCVDSASFCTIFPIGFRRLSLLRYLFGAMRVDWAMSAGGGWGSGGRGHDGCIGFLGGGL